MPSLFPAGLHVAIVGGGLGGLALGIALRRHGAATFTIYEAKGAFTEIGAGINLAPNGLLALRAIDPSLGDKVYALATRNPSPDEDTWMFFRYGAASGDHEDGETFLEVKAPPTGNMTMHRQELLKTLADHVSEGNAEFNKKFVGYEQNERHVTLKFEDGTEAKADVLVGCDGIHSRVRTAMLGHDAPVSKAHFNQDGVYRALISMDKAIEALGETARQSQVMCGPNGYTICYPVNGGSAVNVGAWSSRKGQTWDHGDWILPDQGDQFRQQMEAWGPRVQRLIKHFDPSPPFWATHMHTQQPESFVDGRVILIGDGAHAMPPHQGAGASQAVEDAYVLAKVLGATDISLDFWSEKWKEITLKAALQATQEVRQKRFLNVQKFSTEGGFDFHEFYEKKLEGKQLDEWKAKVLQRLHWIWDVDMAEEAKKAKLRMEEILSTSDRPST